MGLLRKTVQEFARRFVQSRGRLASFSTALLLAACNYTGSTVGDRPLVTAGGKVAAADYSEISGTNGTSVTPSTVTIRLRSKQGGPIDGVVPTFTALPASADDQSFTCGATNTLGVATCAFRSWEVTVPRQLQITYPVVKLGGSVNFTRAASKISITTQPAGSGLSRANISTQPVIAIQDPKSVTISGDNSTVVTVSLERVTTVTAGTPNIYRNGALCGTTCNFTAASGVVNFATAANSLGVDLAGTYRFVFSASGLTSVTSDTFTVTNGAGASLSFTTNPQTSIVSLQNFSPMPVVKVLDASGNVVASDPVAGGVDDAAVTVTLTPVATGTGTATLLGTNTVIAEAGVADFVDNGLRMDSLTGGTFYFQASATLAAGAVTANSSVFTITRSGIPSKLEFYQQPSTVTTTGAVLPRQPIVRVLDDDNNLVTTNLSLQTTISVLGCATVTPTGTLTRTFINGIATFSDIVLTDATPPHDCQLRATSTYGGVTFVKNSQNVRISAAGVSPYKLYWDATYYPTTTGVNQTIVASGPLALRVEVRDAADNLVTSDNNTTATMSVATGSGTLSGTLTKTAVNGYITFDDLSLSATGTHQLRASAPDLVSATSGAFVISSAGVPAALRFSNAVTPGTQTSGAVFTDGVAANDASLFEVQVVDSFGSLVSSANGYTVTLACTNPSGCTLSGLTQASVINGLATFTEGYGLYLTTAGTNIAFTASASGGAYTLNSAQTTFPIVVNPGATSAITSSIAATCPTATNSTTGSNISIVYKDQFGNAKVGYAGGTVVFSPANCAASCSAANTTGLATCTFSCNASGTYIIGVAGTDGAFSQTAVCTIP